MYCICSKKQWCVLRSSRREKTLGEMWAAVIKDINNLLRTAWLRTRAPNGDRAGVSRCSEGDYARHIRVVPQEEHSPSYVHAKSRTNHKEKFQLIDHILQVLLRKLTSKKSQWLRCQCMREITCNDKTSSCPFPMYNVSYNNRCLLFRRLKINHESHEFILEPGTVANTYDSHYSECCW